MRRVRGDDEEVVGRQPGHGQVGPDAATLVEPLGVGDDAVALVDRARAQAVEHGAGIRSPHRELRHEAHVHDPHRLADGPVLDLPLREPGVVAPAGLGGGSAAATGVPLGRLPAADVAQLRTLGHEPVVHRRPELPASGGELDARGVGGIHRAEDLGGALGPVPRVQLPVPEAGDVEPRDVDVGPAVDDPLGDDPAQATGGQHPHRVEPGADEVAVDAGRLADRRGEVGREGLGPAEERADADRLDDGDAGDRALDEGPHAVPVGRDGAEGEVPRDAVDVPRRGDRLEEADHHAAALLAVVAVGGRVLEDRGVGAHPVDRLGDEVVVLGRLVGDDDAVALGELARPHARAVDDEVALDVTGVGAHADDLLDQAPRARDDLLDRDPLGDADAEGPRAARQAHREVDGVDAAVTGDVEAREEVVGAGQREEVGHLPRPDLLDLEPVDALEGRDAAVLLQAVGVGGRLDEPDGLEAGGHTRLRLEPGVEVAGVEAQARARLARRPEAGHQAGGVPRRPRGEPVALEDEHVGDTRDGPGGRRWRCR